MPPKKNTLSFKHQRSFEREKSRTRRENETEEERLHRRKENADRMEVHRQNESEEEIFQRQKANSTRMQIHRRNESEGECFLRQKENAARMQIHRHNESEEECFLRQKENAARMQIHRHNESEEECFLRQKENAVRMQIHRQNETDEEREYRLIIDSERKFKIKGKPKSTHNIGLKYTDVEEYYIGLMDEICSECHSINFKDEKPSDGKFSSCCHKGKVVLDRLKTYPELLKRLLTDNHPMHRNFIENIRSYNSALGFASMGATITKPPGYGPYCFRIHGQIYHRVSSAHPKGSESPKFAQLYILDSDEALQKRMTPKENTGCDSKLMAALDSLIRSINEYAKGFKMMRELEIREELKAKNEGRSINQISMLIRTDRRDDQRCYNNPRTNEVAIVFQNVDGEPPFERDLRIYSKSEHKTKHLSILDPNCDPMVYPILFPHSELGWSEDMKPTKESSRNRITMLQFYSYRLAIRKEFNPILNAAKLTQQYIVDAYVKIEGNRLNYIRMNQKSLRVEHYNGLMDHVHNVLNKEDIKAGKMVILPSSFQGSPRAMQQNYQDAIALVRKFGKPDLFITMTCNPQWREITENLEKWQRSEYRPDLIARVFNLKLKELKRDLMERHVLGVAVAYIYVIEFQKRGLPHAHLCIILRDEDKPRTRDIIDQMVCAELPNQETEARLFEIVKRNMIHGPCGDLNPNSVCMIDGKCNKGYPKDYEETTRENVDGYPRYRRRFDGKKFNVRKSSIDNRWVVPYNRYLLLKYNCHINVEICASIKSIKYLFKYVYKGHDCANIELREKLSDGTEQLRRDEVKSFLDARYVSSPEAIWRIFEFKMHDISHAIIRLAVHLPNEQAVYFKDGEEQEALEAASTKETTLTAWFKLNQNDPSANDYLYTEIPEHYVFDKKANSWRPRERYCKLISRMYTVSMNEAERYYLRLLLLNVKGATSFEHLKTVNNVLYETFKEAAIHRNLLADDKEWEEALEEAGSFQMPNQLRQLFAFICIFGSPKDPKSLWEKFRLLLIEDYVKNGIETRAEQLAMRKIEDILRLHGKSYQNFNLPEPSRFRSDQTFYVEDEKIEGEKNKSMLNEQQRSAFDKIMSAIEKKGKNNCFFLDGPGGSGKTFLYNTLMNVLRGEEKIVIPVASTGITANLLAGGRTYHSQFKLPIPLKENSVSNMRANSEDAKLLKDSSLIIWDEATMATHYALHAVDRLLKDLMNNNSPFGGKVILLDGDFRQCLPVVKHANRVIIVQSSIKYSQLWPSFEQIKLERNMRSDSDKVFSNWLIKLGDGRLKNINEAIQIPSELVIEDSLIDFIYGKNISIKDVRSLSNSAILCPKNDATSEMNDEIIKRLEGESRTYLSIDTVESENDSERLAYPIEVLNSLSLSGLPPHKLTLKKGCIIMLLRNLNTRAGLCNGSRLIVREMKNNVIDAHILKKERLGKRVFIPRVDLITSEDEFPVTIRRRQFPIKPAFAMTINKSQGQTFEKVGIYLPSPVFSHGQLYVAFSRAISKENVRIKIQQTERQGKIEAKSDKMFTVNCVYREIFTDYKFLRESDKDFADNKNVPPPINSEQMDIDSITNSEKSEYLNSGSECESESVKTQIYSKDFTYHTNLSSRALAALKFLVQNDAYRSKKRLVELWVLKNYQSLANEIITYIRSFPERIYSNESQLAGFYLNEIYNSPHRTVLNSFLPTKTEAKGDCFYHSISIALIGNGSLATAIRFATVAKIIEFKVPLKNRVLLRYEERSATIYSREYIFKLKDFAFSAGVPRSLYKNNINEIRFPKHLNNANLDPTAISIFNYARTFHQFIVSMITNRPIHCYGVLVGRAQRTLWKYEFASQPPINFIHVCDDHYVALLPETENTKNEETYTYFCGFMSDEDNETFRDPNRVISANEIPFAENQGPIFLD
jgi:hypothetical protein